MKKPEGSALHQSTSILESGISCIYLCLRLYMHVCSLLMGQIGRFGGGSGTIGLVFLWIIVNQLLHYFALHEKEEKIILPSLTA